MFPSWFTVEGSSTPRPERVQTSKGWVDMTVFDRLSVGGFPFFPPASPKARHFCSRCKLLLAAVVVHPLGLALVVMGRRDDNVTSEEAKRLQSLAGRDAAKHAGRALWGEWLDELTDLSPVQAWCPRHRLQQVDVARLVAASGRTPQS